MKGKSFDLIGFRTRIYRKALAMRFSFEDAEDLAQSCVVKKLELHNTNQTHAHALIDAAREAGKLKRNGPFKNWKTLQIEITTSDASLFERNYEEVPMLTLMEYQSFDKFLELLSPVDRLVFTLSLVWDLTYEEISFVTTIPVRTLTMKMPRIRKFYSKYRNVHR